MPSVNLWAGTLSILLIAGCGGAREVPGPPAAEQHFVVAGYHPWWTQDAWRSYDPTPYDEIYFFSIEVDSTGGITKRNGWPDRWFSMQRELTGRGVRITPVITLAASRDFVPLFRSQDGSQQLEAMLLGLLRDSPAIGGLQLDFEVYQRVPDAVRSNFTAFVERLRERMDEIRPDLVLSLYILAYDQSDVYDERALSGVADYLVVQGYDLHARSEDTTGPIAALTGWGNRNWGAIVERLTAEGVPRDKIVMSVPYFGYEWPAVSPEPGARTRGQGKTIRYAALDSLTAGSRSAFRLSKEHGLLRDDVSGSPFYVFRDSSGWVQGWFEDHESLAAKYDWIVQQGLGGVAVFPLAYGTRDLEALLRQSFRTAAM